MRPRVSFAHKLRGATDTTFTTQVGPLDALAGVKYCITLDSDTELPRDAARELIGIASHPLNRAVVDPTLRRVIDGYGILQPRVSVTMASAPTVWPPASTRFISEIFSSSGHPASATPKALFLNSPPFSLSPLAQESLPWL